MFFLQAYIGNLLSFALVWKRQCIKLYFYDQAIKIINIVEQVTTTSLACSMVRSIKMCLATV